MELRGTRNLQAWLQSVKLNLGSITSADTLDNRMCCALLEQYALSSTGIGGMAGPPDRIRASVLRKNPSFPAPARSKKAHPEFESQRNSRERCCRIQYPHRGVHD